MTGRPCRTSSRWSSRAADGPRGPTNSPGARGQSGGGGRRRPSPARPCCGVWTDDETMVAGHSRDPIRWKEAFDCLVGRLAGRFARVEPRRRAARLVLGLLSDLPRKNCWTIAEWAGEASPYGMRRTGFAGPTGDAATRPATTADKPRIRHEDHVLQLEYQNSATFQSKPSSR
uniref:Transposase n=1 Tax=Streptomyces flaveolus TaxID=67297 RepID=H9TEB6_9ACTN|nr:transposase [Streptomyces flaveolus]